MRNFLIFIVFSSFACFPTITLGKTHVLLTIDVESLSTGDPKTNIWGRLDGFEGDNGVPLILDILNSNQSKATFYLNVYEIAKYGENDIKNIAQTIVSQGQNIQLHTHPKHMYGKNMSLYDIDDQEKILRKGKELIQQWTEQNVIAHRAGAYAGNTNTLKALKKVEIPVDSSLSPASFSPLYKEGHKENDIVEIENILEIPITYFTQLKFKSWESKRFLDIESSSLDELKDVLNQMAEQGSCVANVMMHSFSITRYGYPDKRIVSKLDALLKYINEHPKLTVSNTKDFFIAYKNDNLSCIATPNFVPHTGIIFTYLRSWERFTDGWKNVVFALSVPVFILFFVVTLASIRFRKR